MRTGAQERGSLRSVRRKVTPAVTGPQPSSYHQAVRWILPVRRGGGSAEERGGDAGVDRDVQAGGLGQVTAAQREDRGRDVLGQHLFFQQRALGVVLAQLG